MTRFGLVVFSITWAIIVLSGAGPSAAADSTALRAIFADPPREYSSGPLWVWNDMLSEEQVRGTMRDLAEQNVKQVFVHPRPGLMTPYLSADWFRLWKAALGRGRAAGHERVDLRREFLPFGFCRRTGARRDAANRAAAACSLPKSSGRKNRGPTCWPSSASATAAAKR